MTKKGMRIALSMAVLAVAVCGLTGCNLFAPFFFFHYLTGADTRLPPEYEIRAGKEEKPTRIMVLTYCPANTKIEYAGLDRDLNDKVSRILFKGFAADKKYINVIKAEVVKKWTDEHPDWKSMEAVEIGRALEADFVICLQVDEFRLFKDPASKNIIQGRCDITARVVPIDPPDDAVGIETLPISVELPKGEGRPRDESDRTMRQFRDWFITNLAERISWRFLPHARENEYGRDSF